MKLKHLLGIAFVALVGGFLAYHLLNRKEDNTTTLESDGNVGDTTSQMESEQDSFVASEEKCDATMRQVYENMNSRNDEAKEILVDIHDEMKKSEDNISSKKADIEKLMENLKK